MIPDEIQITFKNDTYTFEIDPSESIPQKTSRWLRNRDCTEPAEQLRSLLVGELLKSQGNQLFNEVTGHEQEFLYQVFREAGASMKQLFDAGFTSEVMDEDLDFWANQHFAKETPAGNTFLNSIWLAMGVFDSMEPKKFKGKVLFLGEGPFNLKELHVLLGDHEVEITEEQTKDTVVVLGRENWDEALLDELIEKSSGRTLRVYSQELWISVLAGLPDPFEMHHVYRILQLHGYRAGHPGLEFISNGWLGWVDGFVSIDGKKGPRVSTKKSSDTSDVEESPLSRAGYRVGKSGLHGEKRRQILAGCFEGQLQWVQDASYMERWGNPGSAKRLRRLANQIASQYEKNSNRSGPQDFSVALDDWIEDLAWLKETYYHGHMTFSWPHARGGD